MLQKSWFGQDKQKHKLILKFENIKNTSRTLIPFFINLQIYE